MLEFLILITIVNAQVVQSLFANHPCRYMPAVACWAENFATYSDGSLDGDFFTDNDNANWKVKVVVPCVWCGDGGALKCGAKLGQRTREQG